MAEGLDLSKQPPEPPPGQEIDPDKLDNSNSYPTRRADAPPAAAPDLAALSRPPSDLTGNLVDLQKRKMSTEGAIDRLTEQRMEADRARMEKAFQAEGVGPDSIKPWNATEEHRKFETSPLEAFGSVASVFAILASAFTHAPMEHALNGSAAAMNAIRAGDEEAYKRSFETFKVNMDLAQKRFQMQHQLYSDAMGLMQTDATAGRIKLENAARRFGDEKTLMMLNAGMDKELIDLTNARMKTAGQVFELNDKITDSTIRKTVFESLQKQIPDMPGQPGQKDPMAVMRAWNVAHGIHEPVDQQLVTKFLVDHPNATPEEVAEYAAKIRQVRVGGGGNTDLTSERQIAADVAKQEKKWRTEGLSDDEVARKGAALRRELKAASTPITANKRDDLRSNIDRASNFETTIDHVEELLTRHGFLTGLGGKVLRPGESMMNALGGSNSTDWRQFERWVSELKEWAPRILNETRGRPLASEAGQINSIVAGLSLGDTTANTVRAYRELKPLIAKIKRDLQSREGGTWSPDKPTPEGPAAAPPKAKWMDAPLVGPRSEAEPMEATG